MASDSTEQDSREIAKLKQRLLEENKKHAGEIDKLCKDFSSQSQTLKDDLHNNHHGEMKKQKAHYENLLIQQSQELQDNFFCDCAQWRDEQQAVMVAQTKQWMLQKKGEFSNFLSNQQKKWQWQCDQCIQEIASLKQQLLEEKNKHESEVAELKQILEAKRKQLNSVQPTEQADQTGSAREAIRLKYSEVMKEAVMKYPANLEGEEKISLKKFAGAIFQRAYDKCCEGVMDLFREHLENLVKLREEEVEPDESAKCQDYFSNMHKAYRCLLNATSLKISLLPINFETEDLIRKLKISSMHQSQCIKLAEEAKQISMEMLTLVPPAVLASPNKVSVDWQYLHSKSDKEGQLCYYQPTMFFCIANSLVAVKGILEPKTASQARKKVGGRCLPSTCSGEDKDQV